MATIPEYEKRADGAFNVTVHPDGSKPGKGDVVNGNDKRTDWESPDGSDVTVKVPGPEPFKATQN